jgi:hypothetical protein
VPLREPRDPAAYVFCFTLPSALRMGLPALPHRIRPCLHRVQAAIDKNFKVRIVGPSETHVTDQAGRILTDFGKGHGVLMMIATMIPPASPAESWTITTGAKVSFHRGIAHPRTWPPVGEVA